MYIDWKFFISLYTKRCRPGKLRCDKLSCIGLASDLYAGFSQEMKKEKKK